MRFSTIGATALIALTGTADAYVFNQCANAFITDNLLTGLINAVTTLFSPANSVTGCPAYCTNEGATWSLYQPGIAGVLGTCFCANQDPGGSYAMSGSNSAGSCFPATYSVQYLPSDPWSMSSCQTSPTLTGGPAPTTITSAGSCYATCSTYAFMALTPSPAGTFTCACGMALSPGPSANCNDNVAVVYSNANVAPSGVARKRMLLARAAAERASLGDCPAGLVACNIPGSDYGFECIDPQSDIDSCGGCMSGYFEVDDNTNGTVGVDCSAIHGVAISGVSCRKGRCEISRCRKGFVLEQGHCVRGLSFTA